MSPRVNSSNMGALPFIAVPCCHETRSESLPCGTRISDALLNPNAPLFSPWRQRGLLKFCRKRACSATEASAKFEETLQKRETPAECAPLRIS
jgi:hypothetical protein